MIRTGVGKPKRIRAASPQGVYRAALSALLGDGNTVADYRADTGVTGTLAVSSWANQVGSAPALAQGTGANQPIYLGFSGSKYAYCPGVAGNSFSTPNSAANRITGDIDIRVYVAPDDWTATQDLVSKDNVGTQRSYAFGLASAGRFQFRVYADGSTERFVNSTNPTGFAAGSANWVRVTFNATTGAVIFYTSSDGVTWSVYQSTSVAAGGIFNGTAVVYVGQRGDGGVKLVGKCYRCQIYNGIDGTLAVDFNPESASETTTNGATWTAATGEVWTLNATGSKPAQIVGSNRILFDGSAHYLITSAFTQAQPITGYAVMNPVTWGSNDVFVDGRTPTIEVTQPAAAGTPKMGIPGGSADTNVDATLNTKGILTWVWNGANSSIQFNAASDTGTGPATGLDGLTLCAVGGGASNFFNAMVWELVLRAGSDSAATQGLIRQYLKAIHGTP